jgi:glycerol-3-phosphate dehydrogenase
VQPVAAYSALRPLIGDKSSTARGASRESRIWNSADGVLHVAGGKFTTYRRMSEEAANAVAREVAPRLLAVHVTAETPLAPVEAPPGRDERIAFAVRREMARSLSDLLFVSTSWGYAQQWSGETLAPYARDMGAWLGWDEARVEREISLVLCQTALPEWS